MIPAIIGKCRNEYESRAMAFCTRPTGKAARRRPATTATNAGRAAGPSWPHRSTNSNRPWPASPAAMQERQMATIEVKVPDIGGYDDVPVIELLVKVGQLDPVHGLALADAARAVLAGPGTS